MDHATTILQWLGSLGSLLSGIGVVWVAKTYYSQKEQDRQKLELQISEKYLDVFNTGNELFRIDRIKELLPIKEDGFLSNDRFVIFMFNAEHFLEKLEQAISLSRKNKNTNIENKFKTLARAAIGQIKDVARHNGHEYSIDDRPILTSIINSSESE